MVWHPYFEGRRVFSAHFTPLVVRLLKDLCNLTQLLSTLANPDWYLANGQMIIKYATMAINLVDLVDTIGAISLLACICIVHVF